MIIKVYDAKQKESVDVNIKNISDDQYNNIIEYYQNSLTKKTKSRAVSDSYIYSLKLCPEANPADLWWHVIYRYYLDEYSDQSWKRTAGFALEIAFVDIYAPLFDQYGINIECITGNRAHQVMKQMGIDDKVGKSKLDIVLEGKCHHNIYKVFGGLHVKSSLAERIQDDVPASLAMMEAGYWSGFFTLDAKAFPPPHGDAVVRGELGYRNDPGGALKRNYFERDGQFDNCYSYNLRTKPSEGETLSGKKIYRLSFSEPKPDQFMRDVIACWESKKNTIC
ncbi:BsaWI family type II restriction enzyme [Desulfatibacillum aliphaticivorans]|uniref:BsaWI family type II restriction enzyme n=1 Tax=Desulfatibacillum aliphaticivorans TaxID=218208 RepID=UPI00041CC9A1|nr:BsaWI family type II restriction enzyme [Desulfatibacillum aliphaticivorans]